MDDIYPKKLISPAGVMKVSKLTKEQKAKIQADLIVKKAGEDKLTRVKFEKPALTPRTMFADVGKKKPASLSFMDAPAPLSFL